jgi:hypothetical protein
MTGASWTQLNVVCRDRRITHLSEQEDATGGQRDTLRTSDAKIVELFDARNNGARQLWELRPHRLPYQVGHAVVDRRGREHEHANLNTFLVRTFEFSEHNWNKRLKFEH